MQITDLTAHPVTIPYLGFEEGGVAPYVTNHNEVTESSRVVVRVETDAGITGWGEIRPFLSSMAATVAILEEGVAPMVEGHSPYELETFRRLFFIEYTNADLFFAPVEMACWDIVGKDLGKPVYELLGGWTAPAPTERRRDADYDAAAEVPVAYCLGILSPEESAERAREVYEAGYDVLKTKAGRDWRQDVERMAAMHEATDGQLDLRVDPNQGWTMDEAVRVGAALEDRGVYLQYMEQPIRVDAHDSMARLRERLRQPIAPNEDTYRAHNLRRLVESAAADAVVVDMVPAGGITGLREIASVAGEAGVSLVHHSAGLGVKHAAMLHAVTGLPGFSAAPDTVYYTYEDDVLADPLSIEDGRMGVPEGAGLGINVDEAKLAEYATD
jgi:L-alanine-DL-glutamate epimerase-like enolase superfamily enzyme